ncbi:MAG: hypothetical protein LKJ88_07475 [Bacilli bacterium]|jgi:hypothetical protein|nr:hypothetical protein [Bacilli bacterium]
MKKVNYLMILSLVGVVCLGSCGVETSITPKEAREKVLAILNKQDSPDFVQPQKFTFTFKNDEKNTIPAVSGNTTIDNKILFDGESHYYYYEKYIKRENNIQISLKDKESTREIIYLDGMNLVTKISNDEADFTVSSSSNATEEQAVDAFNKAMSSRLKDGLYSIFSAYIGSVLSFAGAAASLLSSSSSSEANSGSESPHKFFFSSKGDGNLTAVNSFDVSDQEVIDSVSHTIAVSGTNTFVFDNYLFSKHVIDETEKFDDTGTCKEKSTEEIQWGTCDTSVK